MNERKKTFCEPEIKILCFECADVITISGLDEDELPPWVIQSVSEGIPE